MTTRVGEAAIDSSEFYPAVIWFNTVKNGVITVGAAILTVLAVLVAAGCSSGGSGDPNAQAKKEAIAVTQDIRTTTHNPPDAPTFVAKAKQWGRELGKAYKDAQPGPLKNAIANLGRVLAGDMVTVGLGMQDRTTAVQLGKAVRAVEAAAHS